MSCHRFTPAIALTLALAAGCEDPPAPAPAAAPPGDGPAGAAARPESRPAPSRESGSPAPEAVWPEDELPRLFRRTAPPATDDVRRMFAALEPDPAEWPGEVVAQAAEEILPRVLATLLRDGADADLAPFVADEWVGVSAPGPETPGPRHAGVALARFDGPPDLALGDGPETRVALAAALAAGLGPDEPEMHLQVTGVEPSGDDRWTTLARLRLAVRGGPVAQRDAVLVAAWSTAAPGPPRLVALSVETTASASADRPLYADVGAAVFAGAPDELDLGVGDWFGRVDRRAGMAFQGMQGLAVGDLDGDGLDDVLVGGQVGRPNRVFVRRPDGGADERAAEMRLDLCEVTRAALIVDLDGDGHQDVVLAVGPRILVGYNDGDAVFRRVVAFDAGGTEQFYVLSAADADGDGDLDLFAGRYAAEGVMHGMPTPYHDAENGTGNVLWRNDGVGRFTDVTAESGLDAGNRRFTLASLWEDFDADGDLDLYVVNDFGRNQLFENDGRGRFRDVADAAGASDIGAGMGATAADADLDGDFDLYVTNMWTAPAMRIVGQADRFMPDRPDVRPSYAKHARGNSLLANAGDGTFADVTAASGTAVGRWGWGGLFTDVQNDGLPDLYVPCGQTTSPGAGADLDAYFWREVIARSPPDAASTPAYRAAFAAIHHMTIWDGLAWNGNERNLLYLNLGGGRFADVSVPGGADFADDSRAAARLDWDDDGREDLVLRGRTAPRLRLLHNRAPAGASLALTLVGAGANRDAIGARAVVEAGGRALVARVRAGEGYLAQSTKRLHFGLGDAARVERVTVEWPDGSTDVHADLAAGGHYRIVQGAASAERIERRTADLTALAAPARERARSNRVPLAYKLPLPALALPTFDGRERTVASFAGERLLVVLWSVDHPAGPALLDALAARRAELERAGLRVVPLGTDEGGGLSRARRAAEAAGFGDAAGYADGRLKQALELVFLEVLGPQGDVPLPTGLLFDQRGALCVLYLGGPMVADALRDSGRVRPAKETTAGLHAGRWIANPTREWASLARGFKRLGYPELAVPCEERQRAAESGQ